MHRPATQTKFLRLLIGLSFMMIAAGAQAQGFGIPSKRWGIGFGNSRRFTGIRFNFRDSRVERVTGINVTIWQPHEDDERSRVYGISTGIIAGGGYLRGIQIAALGVVGFQDVKGVSFGVLGLGSGGDLWGINIGGLGAGAGGDVFGLNIGGLGIGAGGSLSGINLGGLGVGAGADVIGFNFGLGGVGAGRDLQGINIGGLGAGAGRDVVGFNVAVLGIGAGERLAGLTIVGLGVGAGESLKGITLAGLGAGAPEVAGFTFAGGAVGGEDIRGITLALGTIRVLNGGEIRGFGASAVNYIQGKQNGLFIGIVNFARRLKGVQLGVVNIALNNRKGLRVLPVMNMHF